MSDTTQSWAQILPSKITQFTANLAQAANTYDLLTATGGIFIGKIVFYVATAGATFDSVSFQTNQTNPTEIMSAAEGAVANLTVQKIIPITYTFAVPIYLANGQKIQYTIVGATGTGSLTCSVLWSPATVGATIS